MLCLAWAIRCCCCPCSARHSLLALLVKLLHSLDWTNCNARSLTARAFSNFPAPLRARHSLPLPLPLSLSLFARLLSVKLWRPFRNMCVLCLTHKASTSAACHTKAKEREREKKRERERDCTSRRRERVRWVQSLGRLRSASPARVQFSSSQLSQLVD